MYIISKAMSSYWVDVLSLLHCSSEDNSKIAKVKQAEIM